MMGNGMSGIFLNILELSISMMPVIGLLLIISPLINKIYTSTLRYWIWLVISMRLLLPFSLGEGWPVLFRLPSLDKLITEKPTIGEAASLKEGLVNPASFSDINLSLEIITTIYFIGFTIFLIYKLACYLVFIKSIKKYYRKPPAKIIEVATEIAQRVGLNIKKIYTTFISAEKSLVQWLSG